jgi:DNA-binding response OmpR family regulator
MRRRILLVDDEVAVLLTLKAVLEISGFEVDTAASAREGVSKLHTREYQMLITDMRMESDAAGIEVIKAARVASYHPAVALLTAFPVADEDWQEMGADKLLVKPMHTQILLKQIEDLIDSHEAKLAKLAAEAPAKATASTHSHTTTATKTAAKKPAVKKAAAKPVKRTAKGTKSAKKPPVAVKTSAQKAAKRPGAKA